MPGPSVEAGEAAFDQVRGALEAQRARLFELRNDARDGFGATADTLAVAARSPSP